MEEERAMIPERCICLRGKKEKEEKENKRKKEGAKRKQK